ncbi:hypothetical protein R5W24_001205 [Gemmata sp. JC717]|uniref:hypothetical protein n=1 Tax=Gemmata algarum TaxID=2975278 RepID=UPI0021BA3F89|nr:hypothetical protein [Gemmata algarum]MDY3552125.1 hypothetical protein [Gemmata algarum]
MNRTERAPGARRPRAALILLLLAAGTGTGGCGRPPAHVDGPAVTEGPKVNPWANAAQRLKKDTDPTTVRVALTALGSELNAENKERLPALPEADLAKLAEVVPLTPEDREELRAGAFTAHDSVYIADCLYLRDAARSLALAALPPEARAEIALAWVCRQVYLQPWAWHLGAQPLNGNAVVHTFRTTSVAPTAVLRRGSGSGLERAYVLLALLQQLNLDACLVGRPGAGAANVVFQVSAPANAPGVPNVAGLAPRGPFWAVGVRTGDDVRLYDPWRGAAVPFTLKQLRANPDAAKAWFEDPANAGGATLADAKAATVYLTVPVNSLAPRMATAGDRLRADLDVNLAFDAAKLRAAFPDPKPAFWNPPDEPFAYGRVARSLLPVDAGGSDRGETGQRLYDAFRRDQLPFGVFRVPNTLIEEAAPARSRLWAMAAGAIGGSFIEPPNPRERIQRGQFQDASSDLVSKQDLFTRGLERLRLNKDADQQIRDWVDAMNELYPEARRAEIQNNKELVGQKLGQIEAQWKQPGAQYIVDRAASEVGLAEATLLLALCKHEIAERAQVRAERASGPEATRLRQEAASQWQTALSAWRTYEGQSSAHAGFPGRVEHARSLAARAEQLLNTAKK